VSQSSQRAVLWVAVRALTTIGAIAVLALHAGCAADDSTARRWRGPAATRPTTSIIISRPADATDLDPACLADAASREVAEQVYEGLVRREPGREGVVPHLAVAWDADPGGLTWRFRLRPGVTFHDGTPLDAAAVALAFERQRDPGHPAHRPCDGWSLRFAHVIAISAIGVDVVEFRLSEPHGAFVETLVASEALVPSPAALADGPDALRRTPVGTGPMRLERWQPGARLELARYPRYWDPARAASVRRLTFDVEPDPRQRLVALESGAADVAVALVPEDQAYVQLHPGLSLQAVDGDELAYLALNVASDALADVRARAAVVAALNRDGLVARALEGRAVVARAPLRAQAGVATTDTYQPARADALLRELADGPALARPLRLLVPRDPSVLLPDGELVGRAIAANLAAIGVAVEVLALPAAELRRAMADGEHDLALVSAVDDPGDPGALLTAAFASWLPNPSGVADPAVDALLTEPRLLGDPAARWERYLALEERMTELSVWVPLARPRVTYAARAELGALPATGRGAVDFVRLRLVAP
jgi:peptide/nickel transport system substrate-binding protein